MRLNLSNEPQPVSESIEALWTARESLAQRQLDFYQDSKQFQIETLKAITTLSSDVQLNKERIAELSKIVFGTDNPESLHLQFHLSKRQIQQQQQELQTLKEDFTQFVARYKTEQAETAETREERKWQIWLAVITVVLTLAGTAIATLNPFSNSPTPTQQDNPWFQD